LTLGYWKYWLLIIGWISVVADLSWHWVIGSIGCGY